MAMRERSFLRAAREWPQDLNQLVTHSIRPAVRWAAGKAPVGPAWAQQKTPQTQRLAPRDSCGPSQPQIGQQSIPALPPRAWNPGRAQSMREHRHERVMRSLSHLLTTPVAAHPLTSVGGRSELHGYRVIVDPPLVGHANPHVT
jgi:hypothetical protein